MENVILIVHLLLALSLIGVVLMQRSEGGGLGMGGGGGGAMSARGAATALNKLTWILATAFICTSLVLTILAAADTSSGSIMDRLTGQGSAPAAEDGSGDGLDTDSLLPPPSAGTGDGESAPDNDAPLVPRAD
ncbi:preprotein translocase subunit SecG [Roseivivax halodurans JCM 10272]|uniref:Protein-export membrane protein SecG n=1 Tax=Roseivivax halodurans JCM 10272 TaxID=1449350 RepID=X7EJW4_9RHOB|nr:preprotein translocase subunit SecG [Roseivivax halodurans]ETX15451.1 preprotein translocase subunit SecG [Roseivivax halodurans JCM 10272]